MTTYYDCHGQLCQPGNLESNKVTYDHRKITTCQALIKFDEGHAMHYSTVTRTVAVALKIVGPGPQSAKEGNFT
jgi:hypothetical protein